MDLNLNEEQKMIVNTAKDFLEQTWTPQALREAEKLPEGYSKDMWQQIAELGWAGIVYPEEYGGLGLKNLDVTLLMKQMGRVALTSPFLSTVLLSGRAILEGGSEEQKKDLLPKIVEGRTLIAFALVEANALPNAKTVKTTAKQEGGAYVLNGAKYFVQFAQQSDCLLVVARTSAGANPEEGLTMFLVDPKAAGIRYVDQPTLALDPQAKVILENVKVDANSVLGPVGGAWPILDRVLASATANLCGYMIGLAEKAHEMGLDYSKQRVQFGRPIGAFQAIQNYLATSWAEITMAEYMGYYAAWLIDEGIPAREAVSTAKAYTGYVSKSATQLATQLHGGMGAMEEARTTPYLRWAKQLQQTLGTCQYHEEIVAEEILDKEPKRLDEEYALAFW